MKTSESIQKSNAGLRSIETESEAEGGKMEKRKIVRNVISVVAAILIAAVMIAGIVFRHELKTLNLNSLLGVVTTPDIYHVLATYIEE